jgi:RimJ/RimL family protein N-acetyltransferase
MEQLLLRQWRDSDLEPYAAMNADLEVMRYFPIPLTWDESVASLERQRRAIAERGWGFWAVEVDGVFAGFTGLSTPRFTAHFTPCTEIGWRFRREFWGRGLAFRAACEALRFGFESLRLSEIVSFTAASNLRSRRLMERLGFVRDLGGDFEHLFIPGGHELRRHMLYRLRVEPAERSAVARTEHPRGSVLELRRSSAAFRPDASGAQRRANRHCASGGRFGAPRRREGLAQAKSWRPTRGSPFGDAPPEIGAADFRATSRNFS